MPIAILTLAKLVLLGLLYVFLVRAVRTVALDLKGSNQRSSPPPRPAVAPASKSPQQRRGRPPTEVVVHVPDEKPRVVALNDHPLSFGRANNVNVRLDDVYVSDEHAELAPGDGGWRIRDLGSTNGTFLNGARVTQPSPVNAGDQIRIGKTRIEVRR